IRQPWNLRFETRDELWISEKCVTHQFAQLPLKRVAPQIRGPATYDTLLDSLLRLPRTKRTPAPVSFVLGLIEQRRAFDHAPEPSASSLGEISLIFRSLHRRSYPT